MYYDEHFLDTDSSCTMESGNMQLKNNAKHNYFHNSSI